MNNLKNMSIFITGGAGFIGSAISLRLVEHNRIIAYDNCLRDALRFTKLKQHKNFKFITGDVLDYNKLRRSVRGCDIIIHLAAIAGVSSYYNIPLKTLEVNMLGTRNLLEAVKEMPIKRFINFSTSEVYGVNAKNVNEESQTIQGPMPERRWCYAISKIAAEKLCFSYHWEYGLPVISIRPFNIYGPGQIGEGAIKIFALQALENRTMFVNGSGSQVRAWCYIDDLVEGVALCIMKKQALGQVFNIGNSQEPISSLKLAQLVRKISNSNSEIVLRKGQHTDVKIRIPDTTKARDILGFMAKTGIKEGIGNAILWYASEYHKSA